MTYARVFLLALTIAAPAKGTSCRRRLPIRGRSAKISIGQLVTLTSHLHVIGSRKGGLKAISGAQTRKTARKIEEFKTALGKAAAKVLDANFHASNADLIAQLRDDLSEAKKETAVLQDSIAKLRKQNRQLDNAFRKFRNSKVDNAFGKYKSDRGYVGNHNKWAAKRRSLEHAVDQNRIDVLNDIILEMGKNTILKNRLLREKILHLKTDGYFSWFLEVLQENGDRTESKQAEKEAVTKETETDRALAVAIKENNMLETRLAEVQNIRGTQDAQAQQQIKSLQDEIEKLKECEQSAQLQQQLLKEQKKFALERSSNLKLQEQTRADQDSIWKLEDALALARKDHATKLSNLRERNDTLSKLEQRQTQSAGDALEKVRKAWAKNEELRQKLAEQVKEIARMKHKNLILLQSPKMQTRTKEYISERAWNVITQQLAEIKQLTKLYKEQIAKRKAEGVKFGEATKMDPTPLCGAPRWSRQPSNGSMSGS